MHDKLVVNWSLAQACFDLYTINSFIEDELMNELEALGITGWSDFITDWHDTSIEFKDCAKDFLPNEEQLEGIYNMGFREVWITYNNQAPDKHISLYKEKDYA